MRHVGFTGHKDPAIHLKMIRTGFPFDSVQTPLNPFDATFRSSSNRWFPRPCDWAWRSSACMKPFSGTADPLKKGVLTPEEALRYAMTVPGVTVTIPGMERPEVLQQNLRIAQDFKPMLPDEMIIRKHGSPRIFHSTCSRRNRKK